MTSEVVGVQVHGDISLRLNTSTGEGEGWRGGIKLNESGRLNEARRPSERQNSWQQAKHTGLYLGDTL